MWLPLLCLLPLLLANPISYNDARGRATLNAAAAAYSSDPLRCLQATFPHSYFRVVHHNEVACDAEGNTCAGYVAVSIRDKQIIVGFRGTTTNAQLLLEAKESLEPEVEWYGIGQVDRYFLDALQPLWWMVTDVLNQDSTRQYSVLFTGHSLGGALAALAAMRAHLEGLRPRELVSLITYGEPRIGNRVFAHNLQAALPDAWRVVHNADMIPHLPPCRDLGKGCDPYDLRRPFHHGIEIWYPNEMIGNAPYVACLNGFEDVKCSNSLSNFNARDHQFYFGVEVSRHGREKFCEEPFPDEYSLSTKAAKNGQPFPLTSVLLLVNPFARIFHF